MRMSFLLFLMLPAFLSADPYPPSGVFGEIGDDFALTSSLLDALENNATCTEIITCVPVPITAPATISAPGVYCMQESGDDQIDITSDNVLLDLNGFVVRNIVASNVSNVIIRNGIVRGAVGSGISLTSVQAIGLFDLVVENHTSAGIRAVVISDSIIKRCMISSVQQGINCADLQNCSIEECLVRDYANVAITTSNSNQLSIKRCRVFQGSTGISLNSTTNSLIDSCLVHDVSSIAVWVSSGSNNEVRNCRVTDVVLGLISAGGAYTIDVGSNLIKNCIAQDISGSSTPIGFSLRFNATNNVLENCKVIGMSGGGTPRGFSVDNAPGVSGNFFRKCVVLNGGDGFRVPGLNNVAEQCLAAYNSGIGFDSSLDSGNVITNCKSFYNGTGFNSNGSNDFYFNTAAQNGTNYSGVANTIMVTDTTFSAGDNLEG